MSVVRVCKKNTHPWPKEGLVLCLMLLLEESSPTSKTRSMYNKKGFWKHLGVRKIPGSLGDAYFPIGWIYTSSINHQLAHQSASFLLIPMSEFPETESFSVPPRHMRSSSLLLYSLCSSIVDGQGMPASWKRWTKRKRSVCQHLELLPKSGSLSFLSSLCRCRWMPELLHRQFARLRKLCAHRTMESSRAHRRRPPGIEATTAWRRKQRPSGLETTLRRDLGGPDVLPTRAWPSHAPLQAWRKACEASGSKFGTNCGGKAACRRND